jgi:hypothetical protein
VNLSDLPEEDLARLRAYQRARLDEEKELVIAALLKEPSQRTEREHRIVAYSRWGTASGCGY